LGRLRRRERNHFRKQAGWASLLWWAVGSQQPTIAAKYWTERVWYCHNQRWMRSLKEGTEASRSGSFENGQWGKKTRGSRSVPKG